MFHRLVRRPTRAASVLLLLGAGCASSTLTRLPARDVDPRPRLVVQAGHGETIEHLLVSHDGTLIFSATDNEVRLWDAEHGALLATQTGYSNITALAISPGAERIAAIEEGRATVRDARTGAPLFELRPRAPGYGDTVVLGAGGRTLALSTLEGTVELWDLERGALIAEHDLGAGLVPTTGPGNGRIAASADGTRLALASARRVTLFDLSTGARLTAVEGLENPFVSLSGDGKLLAIHAPGSTAIHDATTGARLAEIPVPEGEALLGDGALVIAAAGYRAFAPTTGAALGSAAAANPKGVLARLSPGGETVAEAPQFESAATFALIDVRTGRTLVSDAQTATGKTVVAFSPTTPLVAAGLGAELRVYDRATGARRHTMEATPSSSTILAGLRFDPSGKRLAGGLPGSIRVVSLDPDAAKPVLTFAGGGPALAFSAGGASLVTLGEKGGLAIDLATGAARALPSAANARSALDGTGGLLLAVDGAAKVVDLATGAEHELPIAGRAGNGILSADGKRAAVTRWADDQARVVVFDVATRTQLAEIETLDSLEPLAFDATGAHVAAGTLYGAQVCESATGRCRSFAFAQPREGVFGNTAVALSGDAKRVAVAVMTDGSIRVFDTEPAGAPMVTLAGHGTRVSGLAFSPDGKVLASLAQDGSIKLWDPLKGAEIATFATFGADDWIAVAADGRFDGTPAAVQRLHWVKGLEALPLDAFFDQFFTPHLLSRLTASSAPAVDVGAAIAQAPSVTLRAEGPTSGEAVELVVEAADRGGGAGELRLFQNGKRVGDDTRGVKRVSARQARFTVALLPGENRFTAMATSSAGVESASAELVIARAAPAASSRMHLIVVGINEYRNARYSLSYGKPDAAAFAAALELHARKLFSGIETHTIYDAAATRSAIESALAEVKQKARPEDVVVFYFAGHGVMTEGDAAHRAEFFLVPSDVTQLYGADALLRDKAISAALLRDSMAAISAQKQLLILDACQAGGATEAFAVRGAAEEKALYQLARSAGVVVLAATGTEQLAAEVQALGHGVFTYALLEGLAGGADGGAEPDGKITVKELEAFLGDKVPELTAKHRGSAQWPQSFARGQDFPLGLK